jgi:hypothetical protein
MRRKWYIVIPLLLAAVLVVAWVVKRADGFATAMGCTDSVLSRTDSPDGRYSAFVFRRECGATAADSTQANVQPIGTSHDSEKYKAFVVVDDKPSLNLRWESANQLVVSGITSERVYRQENIAGSIQIRYAGQYAGQ